MGILNYHEVNELIDFAVTHPVARESLIRQMPVMVLAMLRPPADFLATIQNDIDTLNAIGQPVDGVLPIERWLRNAAFANPTDPDAQKFYRAHADLALARVQLKAVPGTPPAAAEAAATRLDNVIQEKVLWEGDLLPIGFITGAARTAASVVRLKVTRHEKEAVKKSPAGQPVRYLGTGWLIGPNHVITNHHVINARSPGEAAASAADFAKQALTAAIEFDYDDANMQPLAVECAHLLAADNVLDFAILELKPSAAPLDRPPLPLSGNPIVVAPDTPLPVNIIQHPGGQTKQIAIRNNLAALLNGNDLSYFTDTEGGSSGSPVCNDDWRVIALHKATTQHKGTFTYQGRETAWVNIGTPIALIVDRLKTLAADGGGTVWDRIGAVVV